jgi:predicted ribosome quality control (RQC) complex YloA/Tae2 family protein
MHNSYFLFRALIDELTPRLTGGVISMCFSQEKDELILGIETRQGPFFIRALLRPAFSCVSFPTTFYRAGKNSINLFEQSIGLPINSAGVVENDRSFYLAFSSGAHMLFKMHGIRSNILWLENNTVTDLFKKQLISDRNLTIAALQKKISYTREAFMQSLPHPERYFVTFDKTLWQHLHVQGFDTKPPEEKWVMFDALLQQLNHPVFGIVKTEDLLRFTLLKEKEAETFQSATEALTVFHSRWLSAYAFHTEYLQAESHLKKSLAATEARLLKNKNLLQALQQEDTYRLYADLIMAHLHEIPAGATQVVLPHFETGKPVAIKLKPELSPQKNAELFYRKSRNRTIEIEKLKAQQIELEKKYTLLLQQLEALKKATRLQEVRKLNVSTEGTLKKAKPVRQPFHEVHYKGFVIRIGRSAKDNDELTLKHAHKNDLWLHACDVPGSHVIVRHQAGKPFPKDVVERAAQLAAWHSKRRNEKLCPVLVTEKKYIRKRKGDAPGLVVAERGRTLMAEPRP